MIKKIKKKKAFLGKNIAFNLYITVYIGKIIIE